MTGRKPLFIEDSFVLVPVREEVQRAITEAMFGRRDELDQALAPFGLASRDIAVPGWSRIVYRDELESTEP